MTWLSRDDSFDPDSFGVPVVGIAAELGQHDSGFHQHEMGQLLFTQQGCINITLADHLCILPPTRVAWIPPRIIHRAEIKGSVGYRSIYLDVNRIGYLAEHVEVLEVTPLLREVLERIALAPFNTDWLQGSAANLLAVCFDEIHLAKREPTLLPLPFDRRLARIPMTTLPPTLKILAMNIGASEKTISRIFRRETGLSYQQWRQQWRLIKSIELLAKQGNLSSVASELEFASDSAFAIFFKKMTGRSPREYMSAYKERSY
ncbi:MULTISPECIES: helix-turn-helix domain-containing protein [Photorhabdus]|uniref:Photorhabdus luminescens subsp. laumondii TTO1 complete genome segment 14/17 n=1 Tax=Photorhabdus laumondii subsp. laumondii (strain DSM 15139 / CIP 105565 / TT01) TaxID=243265 RepID=Q7N013_PHOLL|nr:MULTISPECIES: helix-turn-helix transcriptional regulator [Photorhabdus]AWK43670.1 AraC family transcriptional regulator [Photorhabdus laumondii subsp. laumondii]AXG44351.1 AraC family transcriptional regulator [Photorhabdus laumondii subsp. laumondii]AXG48981.1 AraC family transcriptional regulator [Photorhabdus laumondii subsp. laumondii]KTL59462.1 AraC family transcriptional regulator [Photorhabdus laumondii subsp. laumondii]MCC8389840.1 helix-turn-helix transcriptional regulator [Photorh